LHGWLRISGSRGRGNFVSSGTKRKTPKEKNSMTQFRGRTEDASAPFLRADFWEKGRELSGTVIRTFKTENGLAIVLRTVSPVMLEGKSEKNISVGASAGLRMAVDAAGVPGGFSGLLIGDQIHLRSTGTTETDKGNDQVNFEVEVNRPDAAAARA